VVGLSIGFLVEARNGFGFLVVGFSGFCGGFLFGLGLGFAGWVSVHSVVVVDGLGLGLGSQHGGWKRVWVFGGGAMGLSLEVIRWLGLLAWWWLGFLLIFLLKHGVVVIRWLGLPAWWWLGFLLIFGLGLGFAGWVSVHSVVVVDDLGLGLGSRHGGWKRVWVFGGGAVGLGLEVVELCRIWVFFSF
jgi:hypothetical protein